jgi:hypothetical protein
MGVQAAPVLRAYSVGNGVVVHPDSQRAMTVMESDAYVFTDPSSFADYMRAWFVAHHGHVPVTHMPVGKPEAPLS